MGSALAGLHFKGILQFVYYAQLFSMFRNYLTVGGAVLLGRARVQMSKHHIDTRYRQ